MGDIRFRKPFLRKLISMEVKTLFALIMQKKKCAFVEKKSKPFLSRHRNHDRFGRWVMLFHPISIVLAPKNPNSTSTMCRWSIASVLFLKRFFFLLLRIQMRFHPIKLVVFTFRNSPIDRFNIKEKFNFPKNNNCWMSIVMLEGIECFRFRMEFNYVTLNIVRQLCYINLNLIKLNWIVECDDGPWTMKKRD